MLPADFPIPTGSVCDPVYNPPHMPHIRLCICSRTPSESPVRSPAGSDHRFSRKIQDRPHSRHRNKWIHPTLFHPIIPAHLWKLSHGYPPVLSSSPSAQHFSERNTSPENDYSWSAVPYHPPAADHDTPVPDSPADASRFLRYHNPSSAVSEVPHIQGSDGYGTAVFCTYRHNPPHSHHQTAPESGSTAVPSGCGLHEYSSRLRQPYNNFR